MRKVVAGLAITLDGVIDSPAEDWLLFSDEMSSVLSDLNAKSDAILLGRRTYLNFAELWPNQPAGPVADFMNKTPKYVLSSTLESLEWENSHLLRGELVDEVTALKAMPGKDIQIPGSPALVTALLREGLVDELDLLVHPVVVGPAALLFDEIGHRVHLRLIESRAFTTGVLFVRYDIVPS